MGEVLPPHLSPFVDKDRDQQYIPPEERALYDPSVLEEQHKKDEKAEESEAEEEDEGESGEEEEDSEGDDEEESEQVSKKPKLSVTTGEVYKEVPWEKSRQERQEYRLREKMIKKKHKKLYKSMMEGKKGRAKEIWLLRKKRRLHDEKQTEEKKAKKKQAKSGTELQKKTKKVKS